MSNINIAKNIASFIKGQAKNKGRQPSERYASFDYCFNYFQSFRKKDAVSELVDARNMQTSCLQLGFYLASWGMLRGSSFLPEKSVKFYEPLIQNIANFDKRIWEIDIDTYTDENMDILIACKQMIVASLGEKYRPSDTLITKIMLGVFGNVPAFDGFFRKGFGTHSFSKKSLHSIRRFYEANKSEIDKSEIYTFDYATGLTTNQKYTKAKIIDMIGFIEGKVVLGKTKTAGTSK
jgi:hypothetical protein